MRKIVVTLFYLLIVINCFGQKYRIVSKHNYNKVHFDTIVNFSDSYFVEKADFYKSEFDTNAYFKRTIFDTLADFARARFDSARVYFYSSKFNGKANFEKVIFYKSYANFTSSVFKNIVIFDNAKFDTITDFYDVLFHKQASFIKTKFYSTTRFSEAEFNFTVNFTSTVFKTFVDFSECRIKQGELVSFNRTILPDTMNLTKLKIESGIFDLSKTILDSTKKVCYINVYDSDVSQIVIPYDKFKLYFPKEASSDEKKSIYRKLLKRLREEGMDDSYEILDKEFQEFTYMSGKNYIAGFLQKWWWGYGYNKEWIFLYALGFLVLFTFINASNFEYLTNNIYDFSDRLNNKPILFDSSYLLKFYFALFYTATIFFGLKFSLEKLHYKELIKGNWKGRFWLCYFFIIYTVGLICLGFIANMIVT